MPIKYILEHFVITSKNPTIFISRFCLFVILFSAKSYAACPREDVTYYLKEGFNHEQIVKLCSIQNSTHQQQSTLPTQEPQKKNLSSQKELPSHTHSTPPQHTHTAPANYAHDAPAHHTHKTPAYRHEALGIYGNPDAVFLATAVEAYDVEVTDSAIIFTRKDCFNYGQEDWNEFQDRACPNVKYTITRGGLKIVERDNGIFGLGSTALYISGNIKAEILDIDQFNTKHREAIRATIQNNTKKLKIDVRSGMPQSKVEAILLKLAGK